MYAEAMPVQLRTTEGSATWRALITAFSQVEGILAREMEEETGMAMERYGILLMLAQAEDGSMRPSDLADALPITRSGTTRLVDRLERDGLVERRSCETDRRGNLVQLTPEGASSFRQAGRVHLRGIDEHIGSRLTKNEMDELRRLLAKLSDTGTSLRRRVGTDAGDRARLAAGDQTHEKSQPVRIGEGLEYFSKFLNVFIFTLRHISKYNLLTIIVKFFFSNLV